jgi:hypothetical protein
LPPLSTEVIFPPEIVYALEGNANVLQRITASIVLCIGLPSCSKVIVLVQPVILTAGHAGREERPTLSAGQILILRLPLTVGPFFCFFFPLDLFARFHCCEVHWETSSILDTVDAGVMQDARNDQLFRPVRRRRIRIGQMTS